jgi:hypothetical protein
MGSNISKALENQKQKLELKYEIEAKKADMNHQHKIAELIAQMKQTKLQGGKEILISYMETVNAIIRQNN